MRMNLEPVKEMLIELSALEQEIKSLRHSVNHCAISPDMWQLATNMLLVKTDEICTIQWLLEEEYLNGIHINEIIDWEGLENIQRVVN